MIGTVSLLLFAFSGRRLVVGGLTECRRQLRPVARWHSRFCST